MKRLLFVLALLLLVPGSALAYASPGSPDGYVTDYADILSDSTEAELEANLAQLEASTTIEIAVATVNSLDGDDVAVYANELFREWGIGQKETNNGLLVLVAPNERKMRIEVGYGLEGVVPDITAGQVVDDIMTPQFKLGDYNAGVLNGVEALKKVAEGEELPVVSHTDSSSSISFDDWAVVLPFMGVFFFFFFLQILFGAAAILSRSNSWWAGGIVGFFAGLFFMKMAESLFYGGIAIALFTASGLLFDFLISRGYKKYQLHGITPPWYLGGKFASGNYSGGFGSGSSSGGGGGSFGGGSSGGGGASGSW